MSQIKQKYLSPLDKLLAYGNCYEIREWPNYLELGFTQEHSKSLIEMALDKELHNSLSDSTEIWAPVHAWRTLAQLKAQFAAEHLLKLLPRIDEYDDDWIAEELPLVFKMLGPKTIPTIQNYITTNTDDVFANITALHCLEMIGNEYADSRSKCINILSNELKECEQFDPTYNAFLASYLVDLNAVEVIEIIAEAFEKNVVDLTVAGDFEDVEIALGLKTERSTPRPNFGFFNTINDYDHDYDSPYTSLFNSPIVRLSPKIGRNDPCSCGSGKKYKKCCL